ncbi:MAG: hypothetical protein KatS3mg002_0814 [Candidatus Woesearchaeota archaeon]|nr:MAG: hypothetical protein KatS3mg002_0814 [Candidatus Woesearchaeota archaeon]
MVQQIILRDLKKPQKVHLYDDIEWLGESFGFCEGRDIDGTMKKIIHTILDEISKKGSTSTEEISKNLNIEVQRVNYHLRTLINSGFVRREKRTIILRQESVKATIDEIRKDANRIFDNLADIAEEIDRNLGLKNRQKN